MPQAICCLGVFVIYLFMNIRSKFRCTNSLVMFLGGIAMSIFWYEMALSSLVDSTGPFLIFTIPVLALWCLRTIVVYSRRITALSFVWLVLLIMGMAVFLPLEPVRNSFLWKQDPDAPRCHSPWVLQDEIGQASSLSLHLLWKDILLKSGHAILLSPAPSKHI